MQHQPQVSLEADSDPLADPSQLTDSLPLGHTQRRLERAHQKWTIDANFEQQLPDDSALECLEVNNNVGQFWHRRVQSAERRAWGRNGPDSPYRSPQAPRNRVPSVRLGPTRIVRPCMEHLFEVRQFDRLDRVAMKARLTSLFPVLFLAASRKGDEERMIATWLAAELAHDVKTRHLRHAQVKQN